MLGKEELLLALPPLLSAKKSSKFADAIAEDIGSIRNRRLWAMAERVSGRVGAGYSEGSDIDRGIGCRERKDEAIREEMKQIVEDSLMVEHL